MITNSECDDIDMEDAEDMEGVGRSVDVRLDRASLIDPDALSLAHLIQYGEPSYDPLGSVLLRPDAPWPDIWSWLEGVGEHLVAWDLHGRYVETPDGNARTAISVWFAARAHAVQCVLRWGAYRAPRRVEVASAS